MAFVVLGLVIILLIQMIAITSIVLAYITFITNLIMAPVNFVNDHIVHPYQHARGQVSDATAELLELKRNSSGKSSSDLKDSVRDVLTQSIKHYRDSNCGKFVEDALLDTLNVNLSSGEVNKSGFSAKALGLFFKGENLSGFPVGQVVDIPSMRSILFVPMSIARERQISKIESRGSVVVYNDLPGQEVTPLQVNARRAVFFCESQIPPEKVKILAPHIIMENPNALPAYLLQTCDTNCQRELKVYGYRAALDSALAKIGDKK